MAGGMEEESRRSEGRRGRKKEKRRMDKGSEVDARVDARAQSCAIMGIIIVLAPPHCNQYTAAVVIRQNQAQVCWGWAV